MADDHLTLPTSLSPEALKKQLEKWQPWRIQVDFSNGVSTRDFARQDPFNDCPLFKFKVVERIIPFAKMAGKKLLDIGSNVGHNSIHAAIKYHLACTGIDLVPRHLEISRFFAELTHVPIEFLEGNAETFSRPGEFDVILHFGTLYHLPNPLLSLQTSFGNLRPGGYLALETQVFDHPEDSNLCYFMHRQNNDRTNFWALSPSVLFTILAFYGFTSITELARFGPIEGLAPNMKRIILTARKPTPSFKEKVRQALHSR